jgi:hypothetical protein
MEIYPMVHAVQNGALHHAHEINVLFSGSHFGRTNMTCSNELLRHVTVRPA